jgi:hypothetical protein
MKTSTNALLAACALILSSCGDNEVFGPDLTVPGIHVISGNVGDTVQARPVLALTVEGRGEGGVLAAEKVIRFESVFGGAGEFIPGPVVFMSPLTSSFFGTFVAVTANSSGRASVLLSMGTVAGEAKILVSMPELGISDTVRIDVRPGNFTRVAFNVRDTTVTANASYALTARQADRFGNLRSEAAQMTTLTPTTCTLNGGQLTATAIGVCRVEGFVGALKDTARASIVPVGRMAYVTFGELGLVNTDGSGLRKILDVFDSSLMPGWAPDGSALVIYEGDPFSNARLSIVDTNGVKVHTVGNGTLMASAATGRFSPDGQTVYFSGRPIGGDRITIWRMGRDATDLEIVASPGEQYVPAWRPSVSPNGQTVAFDRGGYIHLVNTTTLEQTPLNVPGYAPSFSPDGQTIAFLDNTGLRVMNANGANVRTVVDGSYYEWQPPQWTSDGVWLLVMTQFSGVRLIRASDGMIVPMKTPKNYNQATLKPPLGR